MVVLASLLKDSVVAVYSYSKIKQVRLQHKRYSQ